MSDTQSEQSAQRFASAKTLTDGEATLADGPELAEGAKRSKPEHFVPIRKAELLDMLSRDTSLSPGDAHAFRRLCHALEATFHVEYHGQLEELKRVYAPFDPDADTLPADCSADERYERLAVLFEKFGWLLERANFTRLTHEEINAALSECSDWGLNLVVDFDLFDRLEIYARGDLMGTRSRRRLRNRMRLEEVPVAIYKRLVLIFKLRDDCSFGRFVDTDDVHIKVFKDIPKQDLEMLLPGTHVKMSLIDRCKILLPTVSGLAIAAFKIIQGALVVAAFGIYSILTLAGVIGYGVRSFYGYLNTKQKYQLNLTESLYYQNLDNNAGVLFRLLDEAEEQEAREAMLAYFFLWRHAPAEGWSAEQLDRQIENWLQVVTSRRIDFEVGDALSKLIRLGVAEVLPEGNLRAVPLARAIEKLQTAWSEKLSGARPDSETETSGHWHFDKASGRKVRSG